MHRGNIWHFIIEPRHSVYNLLKESLNHVAASYIFIYWDILHRTARRPSLYSFPRLARVMLHSIVLLCLQEISQLVCEHLVFFFFWSLI